MALHDQEYQCVCEQPKGPSTALTYSDWEMLFFALRKPSHFCRPDGSSKKSLIHTQ